MKILRTLFAFILLSLIVCSACASQQIPRNAMAETHCDSVSGLPVTTMRGDFDNDTYWQLDAHEGVHRAQLYPDSTGTCAEKLARGNATAEIALAEEVPAYCAQLKYSNEVLHYNVPIETWYNLADALAAYFNLSRITIIQAFVHGRCWPEVSFDP